MKAWQIAMTLGEAVYRSTEDFPSAERFGLTAQMRRDAVSIPSNIAEGAARSSPREFKRFLLIARGSLSELETQVLPCARLGYELDAELLILDIERLFGLINGLIRKQETLQTGPHRDA